MANPLQAMRDALYEPTFTEVCEGDEIYVYNAPNGRVFDMDRLGDRWLLSEYIPTGDVVADDAALEWPAVQSPDKRSPHVTLRSVIDNPETCIARIHEMGLERTAVRESVSTGIESFASLDEALEVIRRTLEYNVWYIPEDEPDEPARPS